jgi:uncharacterized protein with HEPN domain
MTGPERSLDRLERIVETVHAIQRHLGKLTKVQFEEESDDIDLLAFRLSQIGEMTNRLPDDVKSRYPDIPWRAISGMRNLIIHDYKQVIPGRLWDTAQSELVTLLAACEAEIRLLDQT